MSTVKKISPVVLAVLRKSSVVGHELHLPEQLDSSVYAEVKKVINLLGGKWVRQLKTHVFQADPAERVAEAVMTGEVTDHKKLYQFFPTPAKVAAKLVALADPPINDAPYHVLEPSAGGGAIILALREAGVRGMVDACELDQARSRELERMSGVRVIGDDFLKLDGKWQFDLVIGNPPFRNGQDVDHVTKMLAVCRPGGRVAAIMSPGWQYRTDKRHQAFRELMGRGENFYEELAPGEFSESGTEIRTVMVLIQKN